MRYQRDSARIGFFIETDVPGGAEEVLLNLACEAQAAGYEPVIFHFPHTWLQQQCAQRKIFSYQLSFLKSYKSTLRLPAFCYQFSFVLKQQRIALLHSHLFGPSIAGGGSSFLARIPHVATLHDIHMIEEKRARVYLLKIIAALGSSFVVVSKHMNSFYTVTHSLPANMVHTIYNYCDLNFVENRGDRSAAVNLLVLGRLVKLKHVDAVIDAFVELAKSYDNIQLTIAGDGPMRRALQSRVPVELSERVAFLGRREDVSGLLQEADIFVQFSETEGLSMSILEAISSGLPAVVSDVGGNSELVLNDVNGYIVSPHSRDDLTDRLNILIADSSLRYSMGRESTKHAKLTFSKRNFVEQHLKIYASLLGLGEKAS